MQSIKEIQEQACSSYDRRKMCTYDVEFIEEPTVPLIHQTARFWYIKKGKALINVNGRLYNSNAGSFFCILPWSTTSILSVDEPLTMIKIVFNIELISNSLKAGFLPENMESGLLRPLRQHPFIMMNQAEQDRIIAVFDAIREETGIESVINSDDEEQKDLATLLIKNKLEELMILYDRHIINNGKEMQDSDKKTDIISYIYAHLEEHPRTEQLADVFNLSEDEIRDYIKDRTGMSISAISNEMRISKTTDLLTYTGLALTDIAFIVGFTDASHLIRSFEARTGYTPNQYRQMYPVNKMSLDDNAGEKGYNIVSFIGEHYAEGLKQTEVADRFGMTVVEMNKILLYLVERNFEEFLNYLRINQACKLLVETGDALVDIAVNVGYNNVKTFNRNFAKQRDMTPGEFRKTYVLQDD
jgi:AraC-like DNA-binding protein